MSNKMLLKEEKTNIQVTKNFNISEMEYYDRVPPALIAAATELLTNLQVLREVLNKGISIMSGYRSPERNATVGGAKNSQHMYANAADIQVSGVSPKIVYDTCEKLIKEGKMKQGGLGIYDTWVHYDTRGTKARWDERKITK